MLPLTKALRVSFAGEHAGVRVYRGKIAERWSFEAPQGGYVLGLLANSCISSQASTGQPDLIHVTGHFLRIPAFEDFEVHVRTIRRGHSFSNLSAELIQNGEVKLTAHFIFGTLPNKLSPASTLLPPSSFARRVPLHMHPSVAQVTPMFVGAKFSSAIKWAEDKVLREHNRALGRGEGPTVGGGNLQWGAWMELLDPEDSIEVSVMPFLSDMFKPASDLLPKELRPAATWMPTLVLSLEYKQRIPQDGAFSKRTVGLYASTRFMHEGRQDIYVEIWTSPSEIGQGVEESDWREKQICLAISNQMGVLVTAGAKSPPTSSKL